ncbi:hypothetical protein DSO57_1033929 [Entomophthora muscae]|uniref:Uncharacterized protein n=1 Tax=Entomophthora muscae TaxID=34485 RepID=A0ACC2RQZ4_9FUNG|nr:hypothetical protein DSO57_1033929 [Entomophthora muscae]
MINRGREFIGGEFARLLQDWYWPTEGLAPAEVQVYGGDACLVIGKVLEEFSLMQAKYKLLTNHSPLLGNVNSSKPVSGYNPGHTMGTGDQDPHTPSCQCFPSSHHYLLVIILGGMHVSRGFQFSFGMLSIIWRNVSPGDDPCALAHQVGSLLPTGQVPDNSYDRVEDASKVSQTASHSN